MLYEGVRKQNMDEADTNCKILYFSNDFPTFRDSELKEIAESSKIELKLLDEYSKECPFKKYTGLSQEAIRILCNRSIQIRSVYEYWCEANSLDGIIDHIRNFNQTDEERARPFKIVLEAFNRTYSKRTDDKLEKIDRVADALDMTGPVSLAAPVVVYTLFEYYGPHGTEATDIPCKLYFGKLIRESKREGSIKKFSLKTRKFIGNTSMDPTLSFIMANMAGVGYNSLVLDPFVGTGSLLIACAHYGAYVMGTDINKVLLHGRGRSSRAKKKWRERDECVRANFHQYGLSSKYIDVVVADASKHALWAIDGMFDAVVTDPPYGIREQTLKLEAPAADARKPAFMPPTSQYSLSEVFTDLLTLSSRCLRKGGKLVFWLPIYRPDYDEDNIPRHPCFQLVSNCEQIISTHISRRLLTFKKTAQPEEFNETDIQVAMYTDHYKESFRDRYFQLTDQTAQLTVNPSAASS
ncbi:tRNA (guanine(10)-N2)-methyltransferase homolog [Watersipora subatra]|uniref:tRNA (guanine(10)-N2)-methyltransferase homolog n=1 Tax=Watersipora subatra TaxID=2589382 RepID=UPI00355BF0BF